MIKGKNCNIYENVIIYDNVIIGDNVTIFPGVVIGRPPLSSGATYRKAHYNNLPQTIIGDNCIMGCNVVLYCGVQIDNNTMVCDNACIREGTRIGSFSLIAMGVTINYNTIIGNNVKIMDNSHITGNSIIEDSVFIGPLVITENDNSMGRIKMRIEEMVGPKICKFATIGGGANILPGIIVGKNSIVSANSLVNRNVKSGVIVAGNPASEIRSLRKRELLK
ncbi:MAG: transferase [Candidatus Cloacimonetes bacterium]|nr:transferase [Candidatus Cloacimonadota bacterium]